MTELEEVVANMLADDDNVILYRKQLRQIAGSVTSTILLQQILWRARRKCWEPFYKFRSPCSHPLYREGDSWAEELGFSLAEFDAALKNIGTKITTGAKKAEAFAGTTPDCLVIYWTDASRLTWYQVNVDLLGKLGKSIYLVNKKSRFTLGIGKADLPITENPTKNTSKKGGDNITPSSSETAPNGDPLPPAGANTSLKAKGKSKSRVQPSREDEVKKDFPPPTDPAQAAAAHLRTLVDAILDGCGTKPLADAGRKRAMSNATSAAKEIAAMAAGRFNSEAGIQEIFASWAANDYRGDTPPTPAQLAEHASAMVSGKVAKRRGKAGVPSAPAKTASNNLDYNLSGLIYDEDKSKSKRSDKWTPDRSTLGKAAVISYEQAQEIWPEGEELA